MNASMIDVFTAATMLGQNPAEELRGMYWVGNQLVPKSQLQNIWKYGTLIAPSTTNADIIVQDEPEVLTTDAESPGIVATPPAPRPATIPAQPTAESAPDDNLIVGEEKDYRRTAARFKIAFNDVTMRLKNGQFSSGAATVLLLNALRKDGEEAYIDGLKRAGRKKPEIDDAAKKTLSQWLAQQRKMVKSFVSDVESGRYTDKVLASKGAQWANGSLSDMLYKGMEAGDARKMWRWVTNFLKENCASCLALHGQVHQMKSYADRKLVPQSVRLICHGDNCGCKLVADDGPARGRIRSVRYVRRAFSKARLN